MRQLISGVDDQLVSDQRYASTQRRALASVPVKTTIFRAYEIKFHEIMRAEAVRKIGQIPAGCVLITISVHDKFSGDM